MTFDYVIDFQPYFACKSHYARGRREEKMKMLALVEDFILTVDNVFDDI